MWRKRHFLRKKIYVFIQILHYHFLFQSQFMFIYFLLLCFLPTSFGGSVPVVWTSSSFFKTGSFRLVPGGSGSIYQGYNYNFNNALTGNATQFVALGLYDFEFQITLRKMGMQIRMMSINSTGFSFSLKLDYVENLADMRISFLALDPGFQEPFSISYFAAQYSQPQTSPFNLNFYINFTASTSVVLDLTHDNSLLSFLHTFNMTADADLCFDIKLDFTLKNESYYHVGVSSSCPNMSLYEFGFSRIIFDKTAIESIGYNYFNYGVLSALNSNSSTLSVTLDPLFLQNFMLGLNSYNFTGSSTFKFDTSESSGTVSISPFNSYDFISFQYWNLRFRVCQSGYPYFRYEDQLCYDSCPIRQFEENVQVICEDCHYSCLTCVNASNCDSCSSNDSRYLNGTECLPMQGYFQNGTTQAAACLVGCLSCLSEDNCSSCDVGYYLDSRQCLTCQSKVENCIRCEKTGGVFNCLQCSGNLTFSNMSCTENNTNENSTNGTNDSSNSTNQNATNSTNGSQIPTNSSQNSTENSTNSSIVQNSTSNQSSSNSQTNQTANTTQNTTTNTTNNNQTINSTNSTNSSANQTINQTNSQTNQTNSTNSTIQNNITNQTNSTNITNNTQQQCHDPHCSSCPNSLLQCQQCSSGYQLQSSCSPICGDGIILQQCDDNNTENNDGCSSDCLLEDDFECQSVNGSQSVCYFVGKIILDTVYIDKVEGENKVEIKLEFSPSHLSVWDYVDFSSMISISPTDSMADISIIKNSDGTVMIELNYKEDLEGQELIIEVDPSKSGINSLSRSQKSQQKIIVSSDDNQAVYFYESQVYELAQTISLLSIVICAMAWLMMILGLYSGKVIGVEMMGVVQLSFFSLLSLKNMNPCMSALASLRWINGYSFFQQPIVEDQYTPAQPKGIWLYSRFAENFNLFLLLILLLLFGGLVAFVLSKTAMKDSKKIMTVYQRLIGEYTFTFLMLSSYIISCSTALQFLYGLSADQSETLSIMSLVECCLSLILMVAYFVLLLVLPSYFGQFIKKFKKDLVSSRYFNIMLVERLIVGSCLVFMLSISLEIIFPLVVYSLLLIFVIIKQPYDHSYNNKRNIANGIMVLAIGAIFLYFSVSSNTEIHKSQVGFYLPLVICVLLFVCVIMNSIFIVYEIVIKCRTKNKEQANKQFQLEEENELKKMSKMLITSFRKNIPSLNEGEETDRKFSKMIEMSLLADKLKTDSRERDEMDELYDGI